MDKHLCAECIHNEVCEYQTSKYHPTEQCDDYTTKTNIENALLKKIYNELLEQPDTWPEYLEDIFYRYLEERGLYHG